MGEVDPASPVPTVPSPRGKLTPKRLLWGLLGAFLLLALVAGFGAWRMIRGAEETVERHRARLMPEREEIAKAVSRRPALLEPAQEGDAREVVEAFLQALAAVPAEDQKRLAEMRIDYAEPTPPEAIDAILSAHPEVTAASRPLVRVASTAGPIFLKTDAWGGHTARIPPGRHWLDAVAARAAAHDRKADALRALLELAVLAEEFRRYGMTGDALLGAQAEGTAARGILAVLRLGAIDAETLNDAGRVLDGLERARRGLRTTTAVERTLARAALIEIADAGREDPGIRPRLGWRRAWSLTVYMAEALEAWDATADALDAVLAATPDDGGATWRAAKELPQPDNVFLRLFTVAWSMIVSQDANARACSRVARAALAVAEHLARRGTLPSALSNLVPDFLPAVPLDPWDGKPLRYEAGKVWSVGRNGIDDGGTPPDDTTDWSYTTGDIVAEAPKAR